MQIIKPLRLGLMTKAIAERPQGRLIMSGLVCFDLLSPEIILTEQAMWDSIIPVLGEQGGLDAWTAKRHGEVLLWGSAAASGGLAVTQMQVKLKLGEQISKTLQIHGDRHWQATLMSAKISPPATFVSMPLTYERSFGGQGYTANPIGIGYDALRRMQEGEHVTLPNIEYPGNPLLHPQQEPLPAALMPVSLSWPGYGPGGCYDDDWRKNRFPAVPLDYNWQAYNVAPFDQRIQGYFQGGEILELQGMHPEHAQIHSRLPALRMRFFTRRKNNMQLEESSSVLDSVCLFPSVLRGVLIFRSEITLPKGDDLQHIQAVMLACERVGEARPHEHYEEIFQLRTGEDKGLHALSDYQLMPAFSIADQLRLDARREEVRRETSDLNNKKDAWFAAFAAASVDFTLPDGFFKHDGRDELPVMPIITDLDYELGNVDLAALKNTVNAISDSLSAKAEVMFKDADIQFADLRRKAEILHTARRSGDLAPLSALTAESTALVNPAMADMARTLNEVADRLEAESDWPLSQATQSLSKSFQNDAPDHAKINDPLLAEDTEISTPPDSVDSYESRTQAISIFRQIADAFTGETTSASQASAKPDSTKMEHFLQSMGLGAATSQEIPDVSLFLQTLGETMRDAPAEDGVSALVAVLSSLPGSSAVDCETMKAGLTESLQNSPDLLKTIGHGLIEPPDSQMMCAQLAAQLNFKSTKDAMSAISDETQRANGLELLEQSERDIVKHLGALVPDAVNNGKLDFENFLSKMGVGDIPVIPVAPLNIVAEESPALQALRRAKSLALGVPGVYRVGPELPPETPGEIHGRKLQDEFFQHEDPDANARSNAAISEFLQATQDAHQHGEMNAMVRQTIADRMSSHVQTQPAADAVKEQIRAAKMLAMAGTSASMGHSIWRNMASEFEQMFRKGRQQAPVPMIECSDITSEIALVVGAVIRQQVAAGISLAGRDLAGADLRGAQLVGVDLTGAFLEHADLSGADLSGALCEGTVFTGACLAGAKFRGAQLKQANLGQVRATQADFYDSRMDGANLYQADFSGTDLRNVNLGNCNALQAKFVQARFDQSSSKDGIFIESDLSGSTLDGVIWEKAVFIKAKLNDSQAHEADLRECVFAEVEANECDFSGTDLRGVIAVQSNFINLLAVGVQAIGSGWAQSNLTGADFRRAELQQAGFMDARLDGADLSYANLHRAILLNASLRGSCLDGAQLFEASLRGADLSHASLRQANLHAADLDNATLDLCDMSGARRLQTNLEMPSACPSD